MTVLSPAFSPASRYTATRLVSLALYSAGASEHRGLLVSFPLDEASRQTLALPGGEAPDELHVTLCYCGPVDEIGDLGVARALVAVQAVATAYPPLTGTIREAVGRFDATEQSDGQDVIIAHVEVPGLLEFREALAKALDRTEVPPRRTFAYVPHITLAYVPTGTTSPVETLPPVTLTFDQVRVSVGDAFTDVPLTGSALPVPPPQPEAVAPEQLAAAEERLSKLPTVEDPTAGTAVRSGDVLRRPVARVQVGGNALNAKTTLNDVQPVRIDVLEPTQELIPVSGLRAYLKAPRRDPPDVVRLQSGQSERWLILEGHTRVAAAALRGETTMAVRVWHLVLDETRGVYVGTARGLHAKGLQRREAAKG